MSPRRGGRFLPGRSLGWVACPSHNPKEGRPNERLRGGRIEEIDEIDDGRVFRAPSVHFGITSFGVNAFTSHQVGDRLINEHDESQEHDLQEELYLVQRGRATFELDGERVDAPAGTLVFVRPEVKRTAFAEEPETTLVAVGGTPGEGVRPRAARSGCRSTISTSQANTPRLPIGGRELISSSRVRRALYNLACCRASPVGQTMRSGISGSRSTAESFRSLAAGDSDFDPIRDRRLSRNWFRATQPSQPRVGVRADTGDISERWPMRRSRHVARPAYSPATHR